MSTTKLVTSLFLGACITLSGCSLFEAQEGAADAGSSAMSSNTDFDAKLAEVTAKHKAVDKVGGAWTTADETLEKAAEAAKNKDMAKAMKLLKEADDQIELAKAQFESQKDARPHLF